MQKICLFIVGLFPLRLCHYSNKHLIVGSFSAEIPQGSDSVKLVDQIILIFNEILETNTNTEWVIDLDTTVFMLQYRSNRNNRHSYLIIMNSDAFGNNESPVKV